MAIDGADVCIVKSAEKIAELKRLKKEKYLRVYNKNSQKINKKLTVSQSSEFSHFTVIYWKISRVHIY